MINHFVSGLFIGLLSIFSWANPGDYKPIAPSITIPLDLKIVSYGQIGIRHKNSQGPISKYQDGYSIAFDSLKARLTLIEDQVVRINLFDPKSFELFFRANGQSESFDFKNFEVIISPEASEMFYRLPGADIVSFDRLDRTKMLDEIERESEQGVDPILKDYLKLPPPNLVLLEKLNLVISADDVIRGRTETPGYFSIKGERLSFPFVNKDTDITLFPEDLSNVRETLSAKVSLVQDYLEMMERVRKRNDFLQTHGWQVGLQEKIQARKLTGASEVRPSNVVSLTKNSMSTLNCRQIFKK